MKNTLLYLMACSLQGTRPKEAALASVDLEKLLLLADAHSVSAMVCMALEQTDAFRCAEEGIRKKWLEEKNKAIRKNMLLDAERNSLGAELEKNGIWYLPLKGSILKDWYPKFGMREMADNDILFDAAKRKQVKAIFRDRGYTIEGYGRGNHDAYEKPPIYNFEMHVALYDEQYRNLHAKYADVKQRLIPDKENPYRFHFTPEDFYVFVVAHAYKHYSQGGTGVRTLADIYIMNQKLGESLNRAYVESELEGLHILTYERVSRSLAQKLFGRAERIGEDSLIEEEQELLAYYLGSGTYGTIQNRILHQMQELQADGAPITFRTKLHYLRSRMFPGLDWCRMNAPMVYRFPVLLPFFWTWRLISRGIKRSRAIKEELAAVRRGGST